MERSDASGDNPSPTSNNQYLGWFAELPDIGIRLSMVVDPSAIFSYHRTTLTATRRLLTSFRFA